MQHKHVSKSEFEAKTLEYFCQVETSGKSLNVSEHGTERHPLDILRGSVVRYINPLDPVAEDGWY